MTRGKQSNPPKLPHALPLFKLLASIRDKLLIIKILIEGSRLPAPNQGKSKSQEIRAKSN